MQALLRGAWLLHSGDGPELAHARREHGLIDPVPHAPRGAPVRPEDLAKWDWHAGHLIIDRGDVYACSSLPLSKTFAGDLIGLGGDEADAAKLAQMRPERPVKNLRPAPVWTWQGDDEATFGEIAAAISGVGDPRFM